MKMHKAMLAAGAAILAVSSLAQAQTNARDIAKLAITPETRDALVILKSDVLPPPPNVNSAYRLTLQSYDPAAQTMLGGLLGGTATFQAQPKKFVQGYMVMTIKPGTYAFLDFSRQDHWATCFNAASLSFTVRPGEIVYLGEIDAPTQLRHLTQSVVAAGRVRIRNGELVHFFDERMPPMIAPVDPAGLAVVAAMVKAQMPATSATPIAVRYAPARFGTGSDLFGLSRVCGGYYQKKAK